jgi:VWFA-related protein
MIMLKNGMKRRAALAACSLIFSCVLSGSAHPWQGKANADGREVTITVTAHPHNSRSRAEAAKLRAEDFAVRENKQPQQILSVKRATEAPPIIAVLMQDDLVSRVNNELDGIKKFMRQLPDGSRVMTGYITAGSLRVAQDFTTDRERAAQSLHILKSSDAGSPFNPYVELVEALRRFDGQPAGRRLVLMVSDGLDASRGIRNASPLQSIDLERGIREAQRRGVSVFSIYAPSVGLTSFSRLEGNYGQSSLNRLADETGGEAFFSGFDFVSFDPYFKEFNQLLELQWVITYRSTTVGKGFRDIDVTAEADVHLHYPAGYDPK